MLERERTITGKVLSTAGQSLPGVEVSFRDAGRRIKATTGSQGFFSFPVSAPSAKHFRFSKAGYEDLDLTLHLGFDPEPVKVTLKPLPKANQDVGTVYGKVLDSSGTPAFAFDIQLFPVNPEKTLPPSRPFLSLEGEFSINDLPAGSYNMCARLQSDPTHTRARFHMRSRFAKAAKSAR